MTKTQQILAAIAVALTAAGLRVRDDTAALYSFEDHPCILLDCGDEYPDPVVGMGFVYWNLTVLLLIGADGDVPKMAPEPTRAAAHAALYADRTLGGAVIDLAVGPISRGIDEENPACGITQVTYNLKYRTMEGIA
ncbi:hypothetical protein HH212_26170 [Massilia forsythiae]|uniref:DUF3168 domain-containing protein n=1 Tax=Massilia forsythiae TaxID=2728020 RepID=A0A7Z2W1G8_9BURK|nr:hypothetical protein [Massilia forsythiae]QJE03045.1 hypothetical protein HH212_26170 [Massilia forsythiae]